MKSTKRGGNGNMSRRVNWLKVGDWRRASRGKCFNDWAAGKASCGQQSDVITNQSGRYAMNDRSSEVRAQLTSSTKASGTVKNSSWTTSDYKNSRVRLLFEANSPTDTSGILPPTWRKRLRKRGKLGNTSLLPQGTPDFCTLVYRTHFLKPP